jgi:hypothetical protein
MEWLLTKLVAMCGIAFATILLLGAVRFAVAIIVSFSTQL